MRIEVLNVCRSEPQANDGYVQKAIEFLSDGGFEAQILPDYQHPEERARLFVETVSRKDVDYTWIARGGIEAAYLLPHIDFLSLKVNNTLIEASDFTHLALPILKSGFPVLYGADARSLSLLLDESERKEIFRLLDEGIDNSHLDLLSINGRKLTTEALVGGTLQILLNLLGTQYCPDLRGRNLYVEHHYIPGESYLEVKYWLNMLRLKVDMNEIGSLLVGELIFMDGQEQAGQDVQIDLVHEVMGDLGIPVGFLKTSHRRSLIKLG